jgi:hypothetical protein
MPPGRLAEIDEEFSMLTFAAQPPPVQPGGAHVAEGLDTHVSGAQALQGPQVAGGAPGLPHSTYWPCELLNAFILKMASTGQCVNTDMMLGHRAYAQQQLARARISPDTSLQALAQRLQGYFDAAAPDGCKVAAVLDSETARGELLLA